MLAARCFSYLALAWMYVRTTIPVWEKDTTLALWINRKVSSRPVADLCRDLADGVILCGLLDALVPGTCPRHDLLPVDQPAANLYIASRLATKYLGVSQDISSISDGTKGRAALVQFLRGVRYAALRRHVFGGPPVTPYSIAQTLGCHQVIARGMGLQLGVVGRRARFTLYLAGATGIDLVVEVKNDLNDYCSHRITSRSPARVGYLSKDALKGRHNIPLEYELGSCEVRVAWVPLQMSRHSLAIIWRGQHIVGSPYCVVVDESLEHSPGRPVPNPSLHPGQ
ncbi:filamin-A [Procambarus clarkii]|uniref:filamin-A n=1 Tax=Procambarus clarkii TaxID=6728 RepID=UPI0037449B53